jgi:hypothetical protein
MRSYLSPHAQTESAPFHRRAMLEFPETGPPKAR